MAGISVSAISFIGASDVISYSMAGLCDVSFYEPNRWSIITCNYATIIMDPNLAINPNAGLLESGSVFACVRSTTFYVQQRLMDSLMPGETI